MKSDNFKKITLVICLFLSFSCGEDDDENASQIQEDQPSQSSTVKMIAACPTVTRFLMKSTFGF